MKKILALILSLVMILSLTACGGSNGNNVAEENSSKAPSNTVAARNTEPTNNTTLETQEPAIAIPENISSLSKGISQIAEDNSLDIVIGNPTYEEYGAQVVIAGKNGSKFDGIKQEFTWYYSDDAHKQVNSSFSMIFDTENESSFVKEILTVVIMYLDNIDHNSAQSQMQSLVNTYTTYANSDLLLTGDWVIYFSQKNAFDTASIYFKHLSEIENDAIRPEDFSPLDYNMCQSPAMNKGTKFYFIGTVEKTSYTFTGYSKILHVLADDGNTYKVQVDYAYPITEGTKYEFWVTLIDSNPCLSSLKLSVYSK